MSKDIDPEAVKLLEDHNYQWDPLLFAFRRRRRAGRESTKHYLAHTVAISYEGRSDHGLTGTYVATQQGPEDTSDELASGSN